MRDSRVIFDYIWVLNRDIIPAFIYFQNVISGCLSLTIITLEKKTKTL